MLYLFLKIPLRHQHRNLTRYPDLLERRFRLAQNRGRHQQRPTAIQDPNRRSGHPLRPRQTHQEQQQEGHSVADFARVAGVVL